MKTADLRNLSVEELLGKQEQLKKELFALNYQRQMGQVENPGRFQLLKRDIARILTIINEKEVETHDRTVK